ncbi:MAG: hypothetical protein ACT4OE_00115 [Sphingosinicella sp.]
MAIMRCEHHAPRGRTRDYVASVEPVGYPVTAVICGSQTCRDPALIWHEQHEKLGYDRGERIFKAFTATMKVRAA